MSKANRIKQEKANNPEPTAKEFGLKTIEQNLIQSIQQANMATMGNILSFIALERLGYRVTEQTQFRVEGDKVFIWEQPKAPAPNPEAEVSK